MGFQGWLKPYLPAALTQAFRVLAHHVDFAEEEAFRLPDGRWRSRDLTRFIEAGSLADSEKEPLLREIVAEYVDLVHKVKEEDMAEQKHVVDAISTVRSWLRGHWTTGGRGESRDDGTHSK